MDVGGVDALSVAGVSEADLTAVVGSALGRSGLSLVGVRVESINPPGSNITTGGLWRLSGGARAGRGAGMAHAGAEPERDAVSRGHAAAMALFTGLSALPFDQLGAPPPPELERPELAQLVAGRLDMARFILDLLDNGPR